MLPGQASNFSGTAGTANWRGSGGGGFSSEEIQGIVRQCSTAFGSALFGTGRAAREVRHLLPMARLQVNIATIGIQLW
jgi:hypothetical protein